MKTQANDLDQLIHDVNSKCSSLKAASRLLRFTANQNDLLELMSQQAQSLAHNIAKYNLNAHYKNNFYSVSRTSAETNTIKEKKTK